MQSTIASKSLGILKAPVEQLGQLQGNLTQEIAITTQRRVLNNGKKDALLDISTGRHVATKEDQEHLNYPEDSESTRKLVAPENPGNSRNWRTEGNDKDWPHNLHISTNCVLHIEKVFSIVRQRYGVSPTDQMKNLDVNTAIWRIFMSVKLQFILGKITQKICDLPRINPRNL